MWAFVTPELGVRDVAETQAWYRDVLRFQITFTNGDAFGAVINGRTEVFFRRCDAPVPQSCCVRVPDADSLYAEYRQRGVRIVEPIATCPWGMREFAIEDPNGHRFRIGHAIAEVPPIPLAVGG